MTPWTSDQLLQVVFAGGAILLWVGMGLFYWVQERLGWGDGEVGWFGQALLFASLVLVLASVMVWVKS